MGLQVLLDLLFGGIGKLPHFEIDSLSVVLNAIINHHLLLFLRIHLNLFNQPQIVINLFREIDVAAQIGHLGLSLAGLAVEIGGRLRAVGVHCERERGYLF